MIALICFVLAIRDKPIAPASPWQNGFAERLIGSIRHECLDHVIIRGEAHLRRILRSYAMYYNKIRTHRSLDKDAPIWRQFSGPESSLLLRGSNSEQDSASAPLQSGLRAFPNSVLESGRG